jgi:hypothetical protein
MDDGYIWAMAQCLVIPTVKRIWGQQEPKVGQVSKASSKVELATVNVDANTTTECHWDATRT